MSKYEPLTAFLNQRRGRRLRMSFAEIERVIGAKLPPSKSVRAWWSNNPSNNVMTKAWLEAGFRTASVDLASEKLEFVPLEGSQEPKRAPAGAGRPTDNTTSPWGIWKGHVTLRPGVDLTEPSDPDWGSKT